MATRLIALAATAALIACGQSYNIAELACQDAFVAENACRTEAGVEPLDISKEQQCATKTSAVGDDEASLEAAAADYECELAAWEDGDCSTEAGAAAADQVATDCHF